MPNIEFVLKGFGLEQIRAKVYQKGLGEPLSTNGADFPNIEADVSTRLNTGTDEGEKLSYLGTPVFSDLILKIDDSDEGLNIQTVLFDIVKPRKIVLTEVEGRDGSVKEYISEKDIEVNIKGALVNQDGFSYPLDDFLKLKTLVDHKADIQCISPLLQLFDVYNIVVLSSRFPQERGFQNVQFFEINAISETPIELIEDV